MSPFSLLRLPHSDLRIVFAVVLTVLFVFGAITEGAAVERAPEDGYRWKLEAGQRFKVELTRTSNSLTEYETRTSQIGTEVRLELTWEVRESVDGVATIEQKLERLYLALDTPTADGTGKVLFDSADLSGNLNIKPELKSQLQAVVGTVFLVRMKETGEVMSAECSPEALTALRNLPTSSGFRDLLNAEGMSRLFAESAFVLPSVESAVKAGWTTTDSLAGPWGELKLETRYALAGEEPYESRPAVKFTATRQLGSQTGSTAGNASTPDASKPATGAGEFAEQFRLRTQEGSGTWYFDQVAGHFLGGQMNQRIESERTYREETMKTVYRNSVNMRLRKLN